MNSSCICSRGAAGIAALASLALLAAAALTPPASAQCEACPAAVIDSSLTNGGNFFQVCGGGEWESFAFPFNTGGTMVSRITLTLGFNEAGGDVYVMADAGGCAGPDTTNILAALPGAIFGLPTDEEVELCISPVATSAIDPTWVVVVFRTGTSWSIGFDSTVKQAAGRGFFNGSGGALPVDWEDLLGFDFGFCYAISLDDTACAPGEFECPPASCGDPKSGPCNEPNGSPGCDDSTCCILTCEADPLCCILEWTQTCADLAIGLECATGPYECPDPPGPQPNDCCPNPTLIQGGVVIAFDTTGATNDGSPDDCGQTGADLWYLIEADITGTLTASLCDNTTYDATLSVYDVGDGTYDCQDVKDLVNLIGCDDDGCGIGGGPSTVAADVTAGTFYLIRVGGFQGATGSGELVVGFSPVQTLWDTGPPRQVIFNGNLTYLGFSAGNLSDTLPERRAAVPFTVPALPPGLGVSEWHITEIQVDYFIPTGFEQLHYIVWQRTGQDAPQQGVDEVVEAFIPAPPGFNDPEVPGAEDWLHFIPVDFNLAPGDYYLTIYGHNTDGSNSNAAWLTNADDGLSLKDGNGIPFMWRAATFPPGFAVYQLTPAVLSQQEGLDPNDVYNLSFTVRGEPVGGLPCLADIDGSGDVGVKDLLFLLGAWGDCPAKGPCLADFDDSGDVGVKDLLFLLGAWGDCP